MYILPSTSYIFIVLIMQLLVFNFYFIIWRNANYFMSTL